MGKTAARTLLIKDEAELSSEEKAWLDMAPVGREFGSPDFDRLVELDEAAYAVFGSWETVRRWLETPNPDLDGGAPEHIARSVEGLAKITELLNLLQARFVELSTLAADTFESAAEADRWLRSPHPVLRGETPLMAACADTGAAQVKEILTAIKYGGVV